MLTIFVLSFAAVTTATRPEIVTPEPTTRLGQLLQVLQQAESTFASVQKELGLVGSAPLVGLGTERPAVVAAVTRPVRPQVQKAALKTTR